MSKIAIYEKNFGDEYGMYLRKYIDYFCELATSSERLASIYENDHAFSSSIYLDKVKWIAHDTNETYIPTYNDVLRVISLVEFNRGKLGDLVALLSGRDFEERNYKLSIAEESFNKLEIGINKYTKKSNFEHFVQDILWNLGFKDSGIATSQNALNYAYAMYLRGKDIGTDDGKLKSLIRRLLVISLLTQRHSGSFESRWTSDFQRINTPEDLIEFVTTLERQNLTDVFWTDTLPSRFDNTVLTSPDWTLYTLAQRYLGNQSFLSKTLVRDMKTAQIHHVFPKAYLIRNGFSNKNMYNKLANYVYLHDQINIKVSDHAPNEYLTEVQNYTYAFGNEMASFEDLKRNMDENAIPMSLLESDVSLYNNFLKERQKLMALKIQEFYDKL